MSLDISKRNPCTVELDIFYNILRSMNDVYEAIKLIKACGREDELIKDDNIIRLINNYYREDIVTLEYEDMVNLFANNRKILFYLFDDSSFWVEKIKYDMRGGSGNINNFFISACMSGFTLYIPYILNNFNVDPEYEENIPLYWSLEYQNIPIVKFLLDKVDPKKYPDTLEEVMVRIASDEEYNETFRWIVNDGRIPLPPDSISSVSALGNYDRLKLLLKKTNLNPSYDNNMAIREASEYGHEKIVGLLLSDKRVDPTIGKISWKKSEETGELIRYFDGTNYPIRAASKEGHDKVVKLLLSDSRVDPTANDNITIKTAAKNENVSTVKLLLNDKRVLKSVDIDKLLKSSSKQVKHVINKVLKRRSDLDKISKKIIYKKLFEYWEDFIGRSKDKLNVETISNNFKVKLKNNIIDVSAKLEEFSEIYKQQIRGYLLVNNKEMIVIFQSFPKSDVSIVHIKI